MQQSIRAGVIHTQKLFVDNMPYQPGGKSLSFEDKFNKLKATSLNELNDIRLTTANEFDQVRESTNSRFSELLARLDEKNREVQKKLDATEYKLDAKNREVQKKLDAADHKNRTLDEKLEALTEELKQVKKLANWAADNVEKITSDP